ncbi:PspC domain-containing protein [Aerococcaceae bacterium NML210727]|nr:PspC domain-containing protein [Aerococcaceae bacterium NML210727]MCW6654834.1 PspC domain-containing protein [Aerococcaceae bacterium NML201296]MCW6661626.1 PspC domain-containing protein [Aerococcaceae bacterium NML201209]MCW6662617.1 PspC domain-containing protein [Aerococcaceae bacterium NML190073]MCW6665759.1 PspC domain-containing protein [Aerococcaceae bacterium NML191219]MCW6666099.1 PspC domain-containing protein [Aerococcaceae bacterium NML190938]MCW6676201.1 PspC domain-containi
MKYIRRDMANAKIAGVAAGIGEYLNLDPVIIRAAFVLFTLAGGSGVLLYILAAILMPRA